VNEDTIRSLEGRAVRKDDIADAHRWNAYHRFFDLEAGTDRPLALHWLLFTELSRDLRPDGHSMRMEPFPELPYPRRMWAGGQIDWMAPVLSGAELSRTSTVVRAELKKGSAGQFLLASLRHDIRVEGRQIIDERQDIVFLSDQSRPGAGALRQPTFEALWSVPYRYGSVELFRYSALTLNSHRIHYDEAYANRQEGYPTLVVQGPLLASQLMHLAARQRPHERPVCFSYRSVAPVFAEEDIAFSGCPGESLDELAVVGPDGGLRMKATMQFGSSRPP
jgi:3-methylfumaryl-CoA hydratase